MKNLKATVVTLIGISCLSAFSQTKMANPIDEFSSDLSNLLNVADGFNLVNKAIYDAKYPYCHQKIADLANEFKKILEKAHKNNYLYEHQKIVPKFVPEYVALTNSLKKYSVDVNTPNDVIDKLLQSKNIQLYPQVNEHYNFLTFTRSIPIETQYSNNSVKTVCDAITKKESGVLNSNEYVTAINTCCIDFSKNIGSLSNPHYFRVETSKFYKNPQGITPSKQREYTTLGEMCLYNSPHDGTEVSVFDDVKKYSSENYKKLQAALIAENNKIIPYALYKQPRTNVINGYELNIELNGYKFRNCEKIDFLTGNIEYSICSYDGKGHYKNLSSADIIRLRDSYIEKQLLANGNDECALGDANAASSEFSKTVSETAIKNIWKSEAYDKSEKLKQPLVKSLK